MEDRYNVECCEFMHAHDEIVERVQKEMPGEDTLYDLTELFRIFGDSTRIRILYVLFEAEMCMCDIAALLGMTQSAIYHKKKKIKKSYKMKRSAENEEDKKSRQIFHDSFTGSYFTVYMVCTEHSYRIRSFQSYLHD